MDREPAVIVDLQDLTVRYQKKTVLRDVTLHVKAGEVYALLGRNGSGKTSLVRCLLGHRRPDRGSGRMFGLDTWLDRTRILQRVGVVPEEPDPPPETTARRLIRFNQRLYPTWDQESIHRRLERFRIPLDIPFGKLSKGEKGQLMLALALAPEPDLLILDDPTLGLDVVARQLLYDELIGELADRGTTVFITTHDLEGIEGIADRVGILGDERLVTDEPLEALKNRHRRLRLNGDAPDETRLRELTAGLGPIAVSTDGLGTDVVLSRYSEEIMSEARSRKELAGAELSPMSLADIFVCLQAGGSGRSREVTR
jgi:ABC-2 type transport system ATP-binding protein